MVERFVDEVPSRMQVVREIPLECSIRFSKREKARQLSPARQYGRDPLATWTLEPERAPELESRELRTAPGRTQI